MGYLRDPLYLGLPLVDLYLCYPAKYVGDPCFFGVDQTIGRRTAIIAAVLFA